MPTIFIALVAGIVLFFCLPFTEEYIGDGALLLMMAIALCGAIFSATEARRGLGPDTTEVLIAFSVIYGVMLIAMFAAIYFFDIKESSSSERS